MDSSCTAASYDAIADLCFMTDGGPDTVILQPLVGSVVFFKFQYVETPLEVFMAKATKNGSVARLRELCAEENGIPLIIKTEQVKEAATQLVNDKGLKTLIEKVAWLSVRGCKGEQWSLCHWPDGTRVIDMAPARRSCRNNPDVFCYICGEYTLSVDRKKITGFVKRAYQAYFEVKLGDQDKSWAPHTVCKTLVYYHQLGQLVSELICDARRPVFEARCLGGECRATCDMYFSCTAASYDAIANLCFMTNDGLDSVLSQPLLGSVAFFKFQCVETPFEVFMAKANKNGSLGRLTELCAEENGIPLIIKTAQLKAAATQLVDGKQNILKCLTRIRGLMVETRGATGDELLVYESDELSAYESDELPAYEGDELSAYEGNELSVYEGYDRLTVIDRSDQEEMLNFLS
ncbi:hypothetical protein FHG87_014319 [Trinorchestia longiramus]|nr:hypothetical protein FHG87_014319 [Trinorchestia longiramus]